MTRHSDANYFTLSRCHVVKMGARCYKPHRVICLRAGSDFLHSITLYSEPYTIIWVIRPTSDIRSNECWVHSEQHATCMVLRELICLHIIP